MGTNDSRVMQRSVTKRMAMSKVWVYMNETRNEMNDVGHRYLGRRICLLHSYESLGLTLISLRTLGRRISLSTALLKKLFPSNIVVDLLKIMFVLYKRHSVKSTKLY